MPMMNSETFQLKHSKNNEEQQTNLNGTRTKQNMNKSSSLFAEMESPAGGGILRRTPFPLKVISTPPPKVRD